MCFPSSHAKHKTRLFILCTLVVQGLLYGGSVKTINVTRTFSDWRVAGCNCNDQEKQYWYVFSNQMKKTIRDTIEYLGPAIYIGKRDGYHLYAQGLRTDCNTVINFLKQDSNFINIFPHIAEEKLSHNIYSGSNLFYIDSTDLIIKAQVIFNINPTEQMVIILGTCVDSVQRSSNNVFVFGTREEMLCVAQKPYVKNVFDIEKPKPPTMEEARRQTGVDTLHKQYLDLSTVPPDTGWNSGRSYTGKDVTVAICEVGTPDSTNLDFNETADGTLNNLKLRRVASSGSWSNAVLHKTHVAGIVAGSGWMGLYDTLNHCEPYRFRGVAPKALLQSEGGTDYQNADVNTHSDGSSQKWYYGQDRFLDTLIANHDTSTTNGNNNIEIFSAGNEGQRPSTSWTNEGGYISLRRHAKNAIHAGSSQKYGNFYAAHSSKGPHRDGRIAPTIVAPGASISSYERVYAEIDYIRIRSAAGPVKKEWNFNNSASGWVPGLMNTFGFDSSSSSLVIRAGFGGGMATDTIVPALYADSNDLFEIRYRADDRDLNEVYCDSCKGKRRLVKVTLFWHDTGFATTGIPTNYLTWKSPYQAFFYLELNGGWQDLSLPLDRIHQLKQDGTILATRSWPFGSASNDSIARLGLMFWGTDVFGPNALSESRIYKYIDLKGTSMAAPHVAGIAALMLQKYNEEVLIPRNTITGSNFNIHQHPLWPSTIRALMIHTAKDLIMTDSTVTYDANDYDLATTPAVYGRGPDWTTGYGMVQADKAVDYVDTTRYVEDTIRDGTTFTYAFYVPPNADTLKVTIAWDDPSPPVYVGITDSTAFNNKLVNDLDLRLDKSGTTHFPWTLDHTIFNDTIPPLGKHDITAATILANPAVRNRPDTLNNAEVVEVDAPASGLWVVKVQGTNIRYDQDQSTIGIRDQHFSLVFDYPLIRDTAATNWHVSSSGAGDVRGIGDGLALASSGDTVTVTAGSYTITGPDSTNNVTLIILPGVTVNFDGFDAFIYVGNSGTIVGAENVTISGKIALYNTPTAREPEPSDNIIGLFGNLCRAIMVSSPGQTTKVGPGVYSIWTLTNEGLVGVRDADRSKSSVIRLYFPDVPPCAPEPPQPPSMQKTLVMNMRFEVCDDNSYPVALTLGGPEAMEFLNCTFENIDTNGVISTTMIGIGDSTISRTGDNLFTNCLFSGFKTAVKACACTTAVQSPYFTNNIFENCGVDVEYLSGSSAVCNYASNQINKIKIGAQEYVGGTAINSMITSACMTSIVAPNVSLNNIALVDYGYSDFRLSPRSPLVDKGINNRDLGADDMDMVFTFSRFLDVTALFSSGDTIITAGDTMTTNTFGAAAVLRAVYTTDVRPVYEITITTSCIDRPFDLRIKRNGSAMVPQLPADYRVFDATINGHLFSGMNASDIPVSGDSTVIPATPDNVPPAPVANVSAVQTGSDVTVSWTLNTEPDVRRYKIYRAAAATPAIPVQIASVNRSTSSHTDPGKTLAGNVYTVMAYDSVGNQSFSYPGLPVKVEMKDNGFYEQNITKPQIKVTNLSTEPMRGFKLRVWFSREEFAGKEIVVDRYYMDPAGITTTKGVHPLNSNIVYVEIAYPSAYQLNPNGSTPSEGIQFGVHYTNYYPGQWIKTNDWSWYGMTGTYGITQRVTVYDSTGMLIAGNEPPVYSAPQSPVITINDVFGFEHSAGWSVSSGTMSRDTVTKTQGNASVTFSGGGSQEIISTDLSTVEITGETYTLKLDVFVGTAQPNPWWVGTLQLSANCPSAGVVNAYLGQADLTPLTKGAFTTVTFGVPWNVLAALQGGHTDFSFKLLLNTTSASGPYKLDNVRFY